MKGLSLNAVTVHLKTSLILITLPLLLVSAGCGFYLQGKGPNQLNSTAITIQLSSTLPRDWQAELEHYFSKTKISLETKNSYQLLLDDFREEKRVATLNQRAKASEYELTISFSYSLTQDDALIISKETLSANRSYTFDETQVIGKEQEEALIRSQLQKQLFKRLTQQLRRAINHANQS